MAANVFQLGQPIRVGALAADPGTADNGTIYYNTTSGKLRQYVSGAWSDAGASVLADNVFRIVDDGDATKQLAFEVSAIAASTTRTITMPNSNVDLGLVATAIQSSEKGAANGVATLGADSLIPIAQIPPAALERLIIVADQTARFALTTATAQNGDTVKQTDTGQLYLVKDDTQLSSAAGYEQYTAGTASSVPWSGVTGTPTTLAGYGITDALSNIVEDLTPQLGGTLDLNGQEIQGTLKRQGASGSGNFVEEEYFHALTLTASQSGVSQASLAFAHASFEGQEVSYKIKEATSNRVRIGTIRVATNGTDLTLVDTFTETGDVGVTWAAAINGANVELRYTTTANNKTMRADVKRFKV